MFAANCCILVLQLCAGRQLSPFIGVSLATWTAVIGVFMLGISLGNWLGGRVADRTPTMRALSDLLLIGSATTVATLAVMALLGDGQLVRGLPLYPRIAVLTLVLCLPTSLVLSMITPLAIRVVLPDVGHTGRVVGLMYALGTLGSLVGTFLTGFWLIAVFPINTIVLGVAATLLALGILVRTRPNTAVATSTVAAGSSAPRAASATARRADGLSVAAACGVVAVSSFATMQIELAASRVLAPYVGVSLYSWTGIIGVVLAGIAIGNYVGGRLADRAPRRLVLGLSLFLGGLASLAILPLIELVTQRELFGSVGLMERIVLLSLALFFVPVLVLGTISPQAIRLAITDMDHAGRVAGRVYAWSTAGAIVGTFAAGWVLISLLGVRQLILLAGVALLVLGVVAGAFWRRWPILVAAAGVGGLAIIALATTGQLASRCTQETNYFCIRTYFNAEKDGGVMVLVQDHLVHSYVKPDNPAYMGYDHQHVQVDLSLAAAARANDQPAILLIGGGGYTYPRWVEAFLPRATIEVVEIDPGVTETAYRDLGLSPTTRIQSHNLDGRQFVQELARPGHYDLIVQDAVNDLSVPGHIMTKEYNDRVRTLLKEDGVYLLSVIDLYRDGQLLRSALRTMQQTFPHVQLLATTPSWTSGGANVFVVYGANKPLDLEEVQRATQAQGRSTRLVAQPLSELQAYVAEGPQIVLTDQYAPVDNLISILFSRRNA